MDVDEEIPKMRSSTPPATVTPFSINDILNSKSRKIVEEDSSCDTQEKALDMSTSSKFTYGNYFH